VIQSGCGRSRKRRRCSPRSRRLIEACGAVRLPCSAPSLAARWATRRPRQMCRALTSQPRHSSYAPCLPSRPREGRAVGV
jgi:hypothetical protein